METIAVQEEQAEAFSEWKPWAGGQCPLEPRTLVRVRMRFERERDESQVPRFAKAWDWRHEGGFTDILEFAEAA